MRLSSKHSTARRCSGLRLSATCGRAPEPVAGQVRKDRAVALESADTAVLVEHFGQAPAIGLCIRQGNRGRRALVLGVHGVRDQRDLLAPQAAQRQLQPTLGIDQQRAMAFALEQRTAVGVWQGRRSRSGAAGGHRAGGCLRRPSGAARRAAPCRPASVPAPGSSAGPGSARWRDGRGSTGWCAASARPRSRSTAPSTRATRRRRATAPRLCSSGRWPGRWATSGVRAWLRRAAGERGLARMLRHRRPDLPGTRAAARLPGPACRARARARGTRRARRC